MSLLLDLGTGAATPLTTSPQYSEAFFLSPQEGHLSVVLAFGGVALPPAIRFTLQLMLDDGTTYGAIASLRHGNSSVPQMQELAVHDFAAADGAHGELICSPDLRVFSGWRVGAWAASSPPTGHRIMVYSSKAILASSVASSIA